MLSFTRKLLVALIALSLGAPLFAGENSGEQSPSGLDSRYLLGVGLGVARFDTSIEITDSNSGNSIFFDGEGSLGLPETRTAPILYGSARINEKHGVEFYTFRIQREGTALAIDRNFGKLSVNGAISFNDRTNFSYVAWNYRLLDDGQTLVRLRAGVYFLDLKYDVLAVGEVSLDGVPIESGEYRDTLSLLAPIPLIGLDYWSRVNDRWKVGGEITFVGGSYDNTDALAVNVTLRARRQMSRRLSLEAGVNFLSVDAEVTRPNTVREKLRC